MNLKIRFFVSIFFAVLAGALISTLKLDYLESYLYDIRVRISAELGFSSVTNPKVTLVLIDPKTVEKYKGFPSYVDHAEFLEALYKLKPRHIVYDFLISEEKDLESVNGGAIEKFAFVQTAKKFPSFHIALDEVAMKSEFNKLKLAEPLDLLNIALTPRNRDQSVLGKDSVYRRIMIAYQGQVLFHPQLAATYNPEINDLNSIRGTFDFYDTPQAYIHFHPKGSFPKVRFEDVVTDLVSKDLIEDRIVIIGTDTESSIKEYSLTPYSRDPNAMTNAELNANSFQTLINNNSPVKVPNPINIALTIFISLLSVYAVLALKPSRGLIVIGVTVLTVALVGTLLLAVFNIWIDLAHPFLAIFLCYYFFIPYRLIMENRKSWEYIQKNKLLQQVEELKTNFISMMSHDLKTPIARIQGMTEVILQDEVTLSSVQREAVDTIKGSSDDLLKFINSILQYGRIESQGIELHKQSKDINLLLQDVIKKHEFLARVKKIKIKTELEPMFPVQIDVDLIKQVFSNLVENAIKYSHEESTVIVRSKEDGDKVVVEIEDHGMGIPAEDLPNIFMKFFRSHNVKTSTIKGTGLGLYLANYFVELHKGKVRVTSETGKGSVFSVTLPL